MECCLLYFISLNLVLVWSVTTFAQKRMAVMEFLFIPDSPSTYGAPPWDQVLGTKDRE